jgi:hypothetical protein
MLQEPENPLRPDACSSASPTAATSAGANASPVLIRCIAHYHRCFEHADGGGQVHRYRLVPLPPEPGD